MSLSELKVRRLVREFEKLDGRNHDEPPPEWKANEAESAFADRACARGRKTRVLRNGWPDFLIVEDGKTYAVEVKRDSDEIRDAQRRMFTALEAAGIKVFVWSPSKPSALTPWAKWSPRKAERVTLYPRMRRGGSGAKVADHVAPLLDPPAGGSAPALGNIPRAPRRQVSVSR